MKKKFTLLITAFILMLSLPMTVEAHRGRTDSQGGHHDYNNQSGLGSYHYHCGGYPPHLHENGVCPYTDSYSSSNSSSSSQSSAAATPKTDSIQVKNSKSSMTVDEEVELDIDVTSYSDSYSYDMKSSNSSVIKVTDENKLYAVGAGTATITIATDEVSKSFDVTVRSIPVSGIKITSAKKKVQLDSEFYLEAAVSPANATNSDIRWESSNKDIVMVSSGKWLKAVGTGKCVITARSKGNPKYKAECTVNVYEVKPEELETDVESLRLEETENGRMTVTVLPENANNQEYTINPEDDTILKVEENQIIPLKEGKTEITVSTWNGIEKKIPVEIYCNYEEEIQADESGITYLFGNIMDINNPLQINYEVKPETATYKEIELLSSDTDVVDVVDGEYKITGTGKVKLTARSHNGLEKTTEIIVVDLKKIIKGTVFIVCLAGAAVFFFIFMRKGKKRKI